VAQGGRGDAPQRVSAAPSQSPATATPRSASTRSLRDELQQAADRNFAYVKPLVASTNPGAPGPGVAGVVGASAVSPKSSFELSPPGSPQGPRQNGSDADFPSLDDLPVVDKPGAQAALRSESPGSGYDFDFSP
jgi:hypothetical protein